MHTRNANFDKVDDDGAVQDAREHYQYRCLYKHVVGTLFICIRPSASSWLRKHRRLVEDTLARAVGHGEKNG